MIVLNVRPAIRKALLYIDHLIRITLLEESGFISCQLLAHTAAGNHLNKTFKSVLIGIPQCESTLL